MAGGAPAYSLVVGLAMTKEELKAEVKRLKKREQQLLEALYQLALKERRQREPGFMPKTGAQLHGLG